jgi:hypothetical protein
VYKVAYCFPTRCTHKKETFPCKNLCNIRKCDKSYPLATLANFDAKEKKQVKEISRARTEAAQKADQIRARSKRGVPKHTSSPFPFGPSAAESNTRLRSAVITARQKKDGERAIKQLSLSVEGRENFRKAKIFLAKNRKIELKILFVS